MDNHMAQAMNYAELVKNCLVWAETAETSDGFEAFLALAEVWRRIADLEHRSSQQSGTKPNGLITVVANGELLLPGAHG
jgi:hypothetical protein